MAVRFTLVVGTMEYSESPIEPARRNAAQDHGKLHGYASPCNPAFNLVFPRRRRRKRPIAWEQNELASTGTYARELETVCAHCPSLTLMEMRVCALVRAHLPNWQIAQKLGISEKTVENHLRSTRKKLGLAPGTRMHQELDAIFCSKNNPQNITCDSIKN